MSARGHPADRGGHGLLHGGRRLRAGDVRRDGHRARAGHDLPRRPAAGEGRDRRGGDGRGARRRRRAQPHLRRHRPPRATTTSTRWPSRAASSPTSTAPSARPWTSASRAEPALRPDELYGIVPRRPAQALRRARGHRPASSTARELPRVQGALRHDAGLAASRTSAATRSASSPTTASSSPNRRSRARISSSSAASARIPLIFLQNITGFMVGRKYEAGGIAKDGAKMVTAVACARVPKFTRDHRRLLRRRATTACAAAPTGRASSGCGPTPASRSWAASRRPACWRRCAATARGARRGLADRRGGGVQGSRSARSTSAQGHPYYATARLWDDGIIDPARHPHGAGPRPLGAALNAPIERTPLRRVPDVTRCSAPS